MFTTTISKHPPVRAVIWDLDGMVIQFNATDGETSVMDLEALVQFMMTLSEDYHTVVLTRHSAAMEAHVDSFERLMLPLESGRSDDYHVALRWLDVQPRQAAVVGIDPRRLEDARRMGFQTVSFGNPRQAVSELLMLLAEPLAV